MKVIVVDDHALIRAGIIAQIDGQGVQVVGQAASVDEAIDVIRAVDCDVVLLDVHLPGGAGGGGAEVIRAFAGEGGPRFLALSVSDAAEDVVSVVRSGSRGYVTKSINRDELIEALERVVAGDAAFSPKLAGFVLDAFGTSRSAVAERDEELDRLSAREQDVMRLIARGYTYKETASELFISVKTVETHVSACLRKLQLSNRKELSRWAAARGI
ncbi:response regulator [Trueperella bernardiae]|uniref:response regulator n=1 Tax=Trueperella bernardiae TaxID=59561 RepID=UPI00083820FC|nr:response regulator transcription factor [Trueperella bernardiae]OCW60985.1 LuxR family transcriptional regulator [Trueperella bernardiae]